MTARGSLKPVLPTLVRRAVLLAALVPGLTAAADAEAEGSDGEEAAEVVYATRTEAYLDRGAAAGLAPGQSLPVERGGVPVGRCAVARVSATRAVCALAGARPGDRVLLGGVPPPQAPPDAEPPAVPAPAPPPPVPEGAADRLAHTPFPKVAYRGGARVQPEALRPQVRVALTHTTWQPGGELGGTDRERIDVDLVDVPLGFGGLLANASATALVWPRRSERARSRPGRSAQLLVWETSVTHRSAATPLAVSAGRIRPAFAPGLVMLDGVQAGWRPSADLEVGAYGGGLPDPVTLAPTTDAWAAGAYYAHRLRGGELWLRHEGRLGLTTYGPDLSRLEWQERGQVGVGALGLGADARVALTGDEAPALDAVRADVRLAPGRGVLVFAGFRHLADFAADPEGLLPPGVAVGSRHADAGLVWRGVPWMTAAAVGDWAATLDPDPERRLTLGPELAFPRLLFGRGGLSVGYREAFGWLNGRGAWIQALTALGPVRLVLRAAFDRTTFEDGAEAPLDELGFYGHLRSSLTDWLDLTVTGLVRGADDGTGVRASAGLVGRL